MSKNAKFAITGAVALILMGGLGWFAVKSKQKGETCEWCGEKITDGPLGIHKTRCPKMPKGVNMQMNSDERP